jgi:2'-5' RNA ligase
MPRLFAGIELPREIRARLAALKAPLPGARWIEPENLHITLRFAGDIDNLTATEFADCLAQIEAAVFDIRIVGLGAFGGQEPHTLYASVEPSAALEALARATERAARNAGLAPEGRNFKPHVTLARMKYADPQALARYLGRNGGFQTEPFTVERFVLYSSRPQIGGGPYVAEEEYRLQGAYGGQDWV